MIVIAVDFKKAYESIKRDALVKTMMDFKIDASCIEAIKQFYDGVSTGVKIGNLKKIKIEVTSGIRQGCTASTTLFKMVTYKIMEKIQNNGK